MNKQYKYFIKVFILIILTLDFIYFSRSLNNKFVNSEFYDIEGIVVSCNYNENNKTNLIIKLNEKKLNNYFVLVKLNNKEFFELGCKVKISGIFENAEENRNYGGFNYRNYLFSKKICGIIKCEKIKIINKNCSLKYKVKKILLNNLDNLHLSSQNKDVLKSMLLGEKDGLDNDIKNVLKKVNLSHIIAISGMHISYIVILFSMFFKPINNIYIKEGIIGLCIIVYIWIIDFPVSSIRALISYIFVLLSRIFCRKYNQVNSLCFTIIVCVIMNPYNIINIGLWFSILSTYGITEIYSKVKYTYNNGFVDYLINGVVLCFCVEVCVLPLMLYSYNNFTIGLFFSNILAGIFIGPCIVIGFLLVIFSKVNFINNSLSIIEEIFLNSIFFISNKISVLKFFNIQVITPKIIYIIVYYFLIFELRYRLNALVKYLINKKRIIIILGLLVIIVSNSNFIKDFNIFFIDVGQGDSTLIITKQNKKIIIDGGEEECNGYNVAENVLLPYLLDRGVKEIDYMIFSHFDSDHCGGLLYLLKNLKVKNVVIGKLSVHNNYYRELIEICEKKDISILEVEIGDRLNIEQNLYIDILWPDIDSKININVDNNNALVCMVRYKNFKMLFTGDIEEAAEKELIKRYSESNILSSDILKVAHHGSKSSSSSEILELINAYDVVIGVGKNNLYGHPAIEVLERFDGCNIYRTDLNGEIIINVKNSGSYNIKTRF